MYKLILVFCMLTVIFHDNCESKPLNARAFAKYKAGVQESILNAIKNCNVGEKLPEMIKLVREGSYMNDEFFKKFIHCGFKEAGYSLENGRINMERAAQAFEGNIDDMMKVIKDCDAKIPVGDPVTNTFEYFKCFQDNSPLLLQL